MSPDEAGEFVASNHRAVLITRRSGGGLQTSPVLVGVDDEGKVVISTREGAYKTRSLRRDPTVVLEALSLGNRIAVMNKGRVIQCDTPGSVYSEPASQFVGAFIGNPPMNFLTGQVHRNGGPPSVTVADHVMQVADGFDSELNGEVLVGIRAENIRAEVEPLPDALQARTRVVEPLGSHLLITADVGEQPIKITAPSDFPAHPNRELWLRFDPAKVRMFRPS
jgi:multiple sugar transport system ATP-binding protein